MAYSVVLIDDESWALIGMRNSFSWETYGFEVALAETSADAALDYILKNRPDAVFTDIRMDSMTGIDLIRAVRGAGRDTEFVIISGHDDFAYAQTAIREGVFRYMLKPIDLMETDEVLRALAGRLDEKKISQPVFDWIDGLHREKTTFLSFCAERGIAPRFSQFFAVTVGWQSPPDDLFDAREVQILAAVKIGREKCVLLCASNGSAPAFAKRPFPFSVGVSSPACGEERLYTKIKESDIAYYQPFITGKSGVYHYERGANREVAQVVSRLLVSIATQSADEVRTVLENGLSELSALPLTVENLSTLYGQVLLGLMGNEQYVVPETVGFLDHTGIVHYFRSSGEVFSFLLDLTERAQPEDEPGHNEDNLHLQAILNYIRENYTRPLYLTDLSNAFFLSQTYICDLFRKHLKRTFVSHLVELRVQKAAALLNSTQLSIIDIAESVGYHDQYYFSKVFKRQVGLSPQQYRKLSAAKPGDGS